MIKKHQILIVDDEPVNVKVLQRKLEKSGYGVQMANNGFECLEKVEENAPDIILLDIMMPDMDGVETCRRLKQNPKTESIPVVFITAKMERSDRISGLETGAIDYITKPIDMEETLARIRTQLRLQDMHSENFELQQRLNEARRTAAIGNMTQGIAHNLNNLLGVVVGYLDLLKIRINQPDKLEKGIESMERAVQRMVNLVRQLSSIVTAEKVTRVWANPVECVENVIAQTTRKSDRGIQTVSVESQVPDDFKIFTSVDTIAACVEHLIRNAIESYPEETLADDRLVHISVSQTSNDGNEEVVIEVRDQGSGIHSSVRDNLFDPFISTKNSVGRGFGLTVVKHSISNLGGSISLKPNSSGTGTSAYLRIPADKEE